MKLFYHPLSGHSHRTRLFLSLIGVEHSLELVDLAKAEHKSEAFLKLNPFGQLPVLEDGDLWVSDSNAILVYLAKTFGKTDWLPEAPLPAARVQRWLSVAAGQIASGPAAARLINVFGLPLDAQEVIPRSHAILKLIEEQLSKGNWLAAEHVTIADIAIYSYVASAPEGDVDLSGYPRIIDWLARIESLPGFVAFQQTPVGLRASA